MTNISHNRRAPKARANFVLDHQGIISMRIDNAASTFAGVKKNMKIIFISIFYNDILAAKRPVSYMTECMLMLHFSFHVTLLAKSDTPDSHTT